MLTIPQAELMAAVIGTRVASSIFSAFQPLGISLSIFLWSDSQIVLYWIKKMGKIKCQFVHNRVDTIRNFNENHNVYWNYCPTASNPADLLSRGATHRQFQSSTTWLTGLGGFSNEAIGRPGREMVNLLPFFIYPSSPAYPPALRCPQAQKESTRSWIYHVINLNLDVLNYVINY